MISSSMKLRILWLKTEFIAGKKERALLHKDTVTVNDSKAIHKFVIYLAFIWLHHHTNSHFYLAANTWTHTLALFYVFCAIEWLSLSAMTPSRRTSKAWACHRSSSSHSAHQQSFPHVSCCCCSKIELAEKRWHHHRCLSADSLQQLLASSSHISSTSIRRLSLRWVSWAGLAWQSPIIRAHSTPQNWFRRAWEVKAYRLCTLLAMR